MWAYDITAQNPGRLRIRDVEVTLRFSIDVRRQHYDGKTDEPLRVLVMRQPVILGAGARTWHRYLVIAFSERDRLTATNATITFTRADGLRQTNSMDGQGPTVERAA